jgi:hypothetical protein
LSRQYGLDLRRVDGSPLRRGNFHWPVDPLVQLARENTLVLDHR